MGKIEDKYPNQLSMRESEAFDYQIIESDGTFNDDYKKAVKWAKKHGGRVYTMVDGDDGETVYLKGLHFVNRFGMCVLKVGEFY